MFEVIRTSAAQVALETALVMPGEVVQKRRVQDSGLLPSDSVRYVDVRVLHICSQLARMAAGVEER